GLLAAHRAEPFLAPVQDGGTRGDGFDVVHHGGARVQARARGEGGTQPRLAAAALQRVEECGPLTADVRARAGVHGQFEVESAAHVVRAEEAVYVGIV